MSSTTASSSSVVGVSGGTRRKTLGVLTNQNNRELGSTSSNALANNTNKINDSRMSLGGKVLSKSVTMNNETENIPPKQSSGSSSSTARMSLSISSSSRPSMGISRPSLGPASSSRPSMGPNNLNGRKSSVGRRSSAHGVNAPTNQRQLRETRPIADKAFQREQVTKLILYLTSHHYHSTISPKLLTSPTRNDFRSIIQFLISYLDPNYILADKTGFEDDVISVMKRFGYPLAISKGSLTSPGAPHTWPALLAMLGWLVDLCLYTQAIEETENANTLSNNNNNNSSSSNPVSNGSSPSSSVSLDEGEENEKLFFDYVTKSYAEFLNGSNDLKEIDDELNKHFEKKNSVVALEVARLNEMITSCRFELDSLSASKEKLSHLQKTKEAQLADTKKLTEDIALLRVKAPEYETRLNEEKSKLAECLNSITNATNHKKELEATLAVQIYTPAQIATMKHQKQMLDDAYNSLTNTKDTVQKEIFDTDVAIDKKRSDIEKSVAEFNEVARQIELIPQTARNAGGVNYEASFDTTAENVNIDLKAVKATLHDIMSQVQEKVQICLKETRIVQDELNGLDENKSEREERIKSKTSSLNKIENVYKAEREKMKNELNRLIEEVRDTELEIKQLQNKQQSDIEANKKLFEIQENNLLDNEENFIQLAKQQRSDKVNELYKIISEVTEHKEFITKTLKRTNNQIQIAHKQMQNFI